MRSFYLSGDNKMKLNKTHLLGFHNGNIVSSEPMVGIKPGSGPLLEIDDDMLAQTDTDTDTENVVADNSGQEDTATDTSEIA